ncbi:enoyl-CoA hydratase/isomerase family protein [Dictyocaulus viviparus]|uniref:Enoyl-CoA hydratase/isomerase family protein n=1 Tax=Dictyocaulus viviparus TaxID=29172 RepID=A0A0D8XV76_DICVI|nr:enoyl-CoA hydratase/isomerase family protein [Dictyocaulus viviparus]
MIRHLQNGLHSINWPTYVTIPARAFSSREELFEKAQENLKKLPEEPDVDIKLQIYALFKQATIGDVLGSRPGMMDFAGRAKYDAWSKVKGMPKEEAQLKYANLVDSLMSKRSELLNNNEIPMGLKAVEGLNISVEGKAFKIRLNRPEKFNALTLDMYNGIIEALKASNEDKSTSITVITEKFNALTLDMYNGIIEALKASNEDKSTSITVITGTGNYFCSGNDLANFAKAASAGKEEIKEMAENAAVILKQYIQAYIDHEKPLICLINGPAIGIAVTVLPLFDYVLATDKCTFHTPFSTLGQSPEGASSYTFPILMGQLKAAEFLIFNKKLSAQEAFERGLVNEIVPYEEFETRAAAVVNHHSSLPSESLRINKMLLRSFHKDLLTKVNEIECKTICERWQSKECASAISAFLSRAKI